MVNEGKHKKSLERLCRSESLEIIGENPVGIELIFIEPHYFNPQHTKDLTCPDMFIKYYRGDWTVIELKSTDQNYHKAVSQIESGIDLIVKSFQADIRKIVGKVVYYGYGYNFHYMLTHSFEKGHNIINGIEMPQL